MRQNRRNIMGRFAALLLAVVLAVGSLPAVQATSAGHFTDVPANNWAFSYVERAYADGVITGTGGDPARGTARFSPGAEVTFGQFYTILARGFYADELARDHQAGDAWFTPALRVAERHGMSRFSVDQLIGMAGTPLNRYEAAFIIVRLMQDQGVAVPGSDERDAAAAKIGDWNAVLDKGSTWNYFVAAAYAAGIITGVDSSGTFAGDGTIRRDSAATIYTRLADKVAQAHAALRQEYQIVYGDGWELIPDPVYREEVEQAFYETFPRAWTRWGGARVRKSVDIRVREILGDSASTWMWASSTQNEDGTRSPYIEISAIHKNSSPLRPIPHELCHTLQGYSGFHTDWWTQDMADYCAFRYFVWADAANMTADTRYYFEGDEQELRDWNFETSHCSVWFFAYMDSKYPTTRQGDGLIDAIHNGIIAGEITSDDPSDPNLNAVVKRITGYDTIGQLRQRYIQELDAGTWTFNGFADYADNYITEDIPGLPNPTYPTREDFNLCSSGYTYYIFGENPNSPADNLVDGDLSTMWQTSAKKDGQQKLNIDLRGSVTFNTYTIYHAGSRGDSKENTVSWILGYCDSETGDWKVLDEVTGNTQDVTTRTVETVTADYLWLEILNPSGTGDGTVRLYELELYNKG